MLDQNTVTVPSRRQSVWDEKRVWREPARERRRTLFMALGVGLVIVIVVACFSYSRVWDGNCKPGQTGYACTPSKMKR